MKVYFFYVMTNYVFFKKSKIKLLTLNIIYCMITSVYEIVVLHGKTSFY